MPRYETVAAAIEVLGNSDDWLIAGWMARDRAVVVRLERNATRLIVDDGGEAIRAVCIDTLQDLLEALPDEARPGDVGYERARAAIIDSYPGD